MKVELACGSDGRPLLISYSMKPRQSLAFVRRSLVPVREAVLPTLPVTSPLREMADELYVRQGDQIRGQLARRGDNEEWPQVVVDLADEHPE